MSRSVLADPWDILIGLRPGLVRALANLAGSTEGDLLVTLQVMPWGDRATLAGYGVIELERTASGRGRVVSVHPDAVELVNVAASMVNSADELAEPEFVEQQQAEAEDVTASRAELLAGAALPLIEVVHQQVATDDTCVSGVVEKVEPLGSLGRVRIRVHRGSGKEDGTIEVAADRAELHSGSEVALCYATPTDWLAHPKSMHVLSDSH